jgi:hypothetical protein
LLKDVVGLGVTPLILPLVRALLALGGGLPLECLLSSLSDIGLTA